MKARITTKIAMLLAGILLVSTLFLGYVNYTDSEALAIDILKKNNLSELSNIRDYYFNKLIIDMEHIVNKWANSPVIREYRKPPGTPKIVSSIPDDFLEIYRQWTGLTESHKDIEWIYYALEKDGSIYIAPVDDTMPDDYDARRRDWYRGTVAQQGAVYWTEPYLDAGASGKMLQTVSKAVYSRGELLGVIGLDIELTKFTEIIGQLSLAKKSTVFLLNDQGRIIAHNAENPSFYSSNFLHRLDPDNPSEIVSVGNSKYILSWVLLSINNWKLAAITRTDFESELLYTKLRISGIVFLTLLFAVFAAVLLARSILKPLQYLMRTTAEVAAGNIDIRSPVVSGDEFGSLSESFNEMLDQLRSLIDERDNNYIHTVKVLANAIEASDEYTRGHCDRVGAISLKIADRVRLTPRRRKNLEFACILHDIGKIAVPGNILNKPARLDEDEYALIKQHPLIGYEILKEIPFLMEPAAILLQHHERIDGTGYPSSIKGEHIRLEARIMAVADAYDAMSSFRVYRETPLTEREIREELLRAAGTQLDEKLVEVLLELLENERGFSFPPEA